LATAPIVIGASPAGAQTATLGLRKSVSLPAPPQAAPAQPFTFFLSYACSSLTEDCRGAKIVDVLPPTLSRAATDVKFGGNFRTVAYDPATGTVTFTLFDPLAAGTTAQVAISAQFPPGTAPGTAATNRGTMSASNATSVTSNPVTVTAKAASQWTVSKSLAPGQTAQVDTPVTYRVAFTLAAGGTQNLNNVSLVDTLPAGAVFVSATNGGVPTPPGKVTWNIGNLVPQPNTDVTVTRDVTVRFPSPTFKSGQTVVNGVDAIGQPAGEPTPRLLGHAERPAILKAAGSVTSGSKKDTKPSLGPGQSDTYTITASNPNNVPLANFTILEDLPVQLSMLQPGPNLSGANPAPTIAVSPNGTTFTNLPVNGGGGGWTATAPANTDQIRFTFATVPAAFSTTITVKAGIPANGIDRAGNPITSGTSIQNCAAISGTGTPTVRRCTTQTIQSVAVDLAKTLTSGPITAPGAIVNWSITAGVPATSASSLVGPTFVDCLPVGLDLVNPANPADPLNGSVTGFAATPTITRIPNGCGAANNQTRIQWTFPPGFQIAVGQAGEFKLNTVVALDTPPGSVINTVTLSAAQLQTPLTRTANLAVTSSTLLVGNKKVKGQLDAGFLGFPDVGHTVRGGSAIYQGTIRNVSEVPVNHVVVIDTLPIPGDVGVISPAARGSAWEPLLSGPASAPSVSSISYSSSHNPCRPELNVNPPGCQAANWGGLPSPASSVGAIKLDYGTLVLQPGASLSFAFPVSAPTNAPEGVVAWNSFGYTGIRADNFSELEPSEPQKVGLVLGVTPPPGIDLIKFVNGFHVPDPPGIVINAGAPVNFTYKVTNTAKLTLINITLVDDQIGTIPCPKTTLVPGESMTCTAAPQVARAGQYANTAVVTGQPVDSGGHPTGPPLTDLDRGHYNNSIPATGSNSSLIAVVGGVLLVLGFGLVRLGRRRPTVLPG